MNTSGEDVLLFENEEWMVTGAGLEHKRTGYFIEAEELGQRRSDGLWIWPVHMAEKSWCAPDPFAEAFLEALSGRGVRPDAGLAKSFAAAGHSALEQALWDRVAGHGRGEAGAGRALSLGEVLAISVDMHRRTGIGLDPDRPVGGELADGEGADHAVPAQGKTLPEPIPALAYRPMRAAPSRRPRAYRISRAGSRLLAWLRVGWNKK